MTDMKKYLLSLTVLFSMLLVASPAEATANNLVWTDLSSKLDLRQNRPVWAMAYGNGNWFYTDGQDLWNGGQVYRYDGAVQTNITLQVRNAGLSRVDDIVSDGISILFLQDVVRLDNQLKAVIYRWGTYSNATGVLRTVLDLNEGISSIVGRNGVWMMVSTRARLVKFNEDLTSYARLAAPSEVKEMGTSSGFLLYSKNHRMDSQYTGIILAPAGNTFLLGVSSGLYQTYAASYTTFYRYNGQSFTEIKKDNYPYSLKAVAFNSNSAYIMANAGVYNADNFIEAYDGISWRRTANLNPPLFLAPQPRSNFSMAWDGKQWLMVYGKELYRLADTQTNQPTSIELIGEVRDYFVTAASNGNGTTLFGGAMSVIGNSQPTSPLTAKLTKVTEGAAPSTVSPASAVPTPVNTVITTTNKIGLNNWQWLSPNTAVLSRGESTTYNVGAQSFKGLKRTELVVNGTVKKTCDWNGAKTNTVCAFTLNGSDYPTNTHVAFNAKITDFLNRVVWMPLWKIKVQEAPVNVPANSVKDSGTGIITWNSLTPETSSLATYGYATYNVGAWHADGIKRIEILVNGVTRHTCELGNAKGPQTCAYTLYKNDYPAGTQVAFNARVTDANDKFTWTPLRTVMSSAGIITATSPQPGTPSGSTIWTWYVPSNTTPTYTQATYHVGAWDADGIARVEMYLNGVMKQICTYNNSTVNVSCSLDVYPWTYAHDTNVVANAKIVDVYGNATWSNSTSWRVIWTAIYANSWTYALSAN